MCYDCDEYEDYDNYDPEDYEEYCPCCGAHFSFCLCDCWLTEFEEVRPSIMDINEMLGAFDDETQETLIDVDETFSAIPFGEWEDGFSNHSDDYYESGAYYDDYPF